MTLKIITICVMGSLLSSCLRREQQTLYTIHDFKDYVIREERGGELPNKGESSWVGYWKDQYARFRKHGDAINIDGEAVIYAIETERIKRGLPRIKGALVLPRD